MKTRTNLKAWLATSVLLLAMGDGIATGAVIYVDADAAPSGNGTSRANAYKYLQDALDVATSGDDIWAAEGVYKPDQGATVTLGDREATFHLKNGVAIYGGIGGGESILSGDIGTAGDSSENSYHVVTGSQTDSTALLDGFTITAGNASEHSVSLTSPGGGGMYNAAGSPTISNCTFSENSAAYPSNGGGMSNINNSNPTLTNCIFSGNSVGVGGGGMYNRNSSPTLTNCTFSGNSGGNWGGGMYNLGYYRECSPTLTNCTFTGNSAGYGGGMYDVFSSLTVTNCTFSGNSAYLYGGGIYNGYESSSTVTNCTFSGNSSNYGGGMCNSGRSATVTNCTFSGNSAVWDGGGMFNGSSLTLTNCTFSGNSAVRRGAGMNNLIGGSPTLSNCILWGNTTSSGPQQIYGSATVTYCDVQGDYGGTGNINADPMFMDTDLRLSPGSPCIDAGDNTAVPDGVTTDLDGNPRIFNGIVDMGAYEFQVPSNQPPVADAGPDQTVEQNSLGGASVTLDGSGSSDPDDDALTYAWTWDGGSATGEAPMVVLPPGTTTVTLVVNDGTEDSEPDQVSITVQDTTPAEIKLFEPDPSVLWPANHTFVDVVIMGFALDICDVELDVEVWVEVIDAEDGDGGPAHEPDCEILAVGIEEDEISILVALRAERSAQGDGRIYEITAAVTDDSDNTATSNPVEVIVPHDQGKGKGKKK